MTALFNKLFERLTRYMELLMLQTNRIVVGLTLLLLIGGISACSNEASTKNVEILGAPSPIAYLGVEYSYNFGSSGGENLHNYSLSNHPAWLSLETINNNARLGVIARGVPGITGGRRGLEDVTKNEDVTLALTDNGKYGSFSWDLDVKENTIEIFGPEGYVEGTVPETDEQPVNSTDECAYPDMTVKNITVDGVDYKLFPVLAEVNLLQPSVETVKVRYEFRTSYDENRTEQDGPNKSRARKNHDYIIDYDKDDPENLMFYNALYSPDDTFEPGVVTFEPGVTKCFIRAYVNEDLVAEATETFSIYLGEVIEGIATVGAQKFDAVAIEDNEPIVSIKDATSVVQNEGSTKTFTAKLDKSPGFVVKKNPDGSSTSTPVEFTLALQFSEDDSTDNANNDDYLIYTWSQSPDAPVDEIDEATGCVRWGSEPIVAVPGQVDLAFSGDQTERQFRVCLVNNGDNDPGKDDQLVFLFRDDFGTVSARPSGEKFSVFVNEWLSDVVVASPAEKIVDSVVDADGNVIILGAVDGSPPFLRLFNRFGQIFPSDIVVLEGRNGVSRPVALAYSEAINTANGAQEDTDPTNNRVYHLAVLVETDAGLSDGSTGSDVYLGVYSRVSNEANYTFKWEYQIGSPENDVPTGLSSVGSTYYISGTTFGDWSRELIEGIGDVWEDQTHAGNGDIFLSKVSLNGEEPFNNWTKLVGGADTETGLGVAANFGRVSVTGQTSGKVGQDYFGGIDGVVVSVQASNSDIVSTTQFGSSFDDEITNAIANQNVWVSVSGVEEVFDDAEDLEKLVEDDIEIKQYDTKAIQHLRFGSDNRIAGEGLIIDSLDGDDYVRASVASDLANYLGGETTGVLSSIQEDTVVFATENAGLNDAFIVKTSFTSKETDPVKASWVLQFGSDLDDSVVDLALDNKVKLSVVWKEGEITKVSKIASDGAFLTR
jgi:hypothetical protein